jgi:TnpA family transposase
MKKSVTNNEIKARLLDFESILGFISNLDLVKQTYENKVKDRKSINTEKEMEGKLNTLMYRLEEIEQSQATRKSCLKKPNKIMFNDTSK